MHEPLQLPSCTCVTYGGKHRHAIDTVLCITCRFVNTIDLSRKQLDQALDDWKKKNDV